MKEKVFKFIWRKHLHGCELVKITGWRSALIDRTGQRVRSTFLICWPFNK